MARIARRRGIGLRTASIVRDLPTRAGGRSWAESDDTLGARFTFTQPRAVTPDAAV
jgi:signal transduction histidine kinase